MIFKPSYSFKAYHDSNAYTALDLHNGVTDASSEALRDVLLPSVCTLEQLRSIWCAPLPLDNGDTSK